jgi:hypothetical protein
MISNTWTKAPADLLGLGGFDMRGAFGPGLCSGFAEYLAAPANAPIAAYQGTGLPSGGTSVRLRPVTRHAIGDVVVTKTFENTTFENTGTTLGNLSPGRPQS